MKKALEVLMFLLIVGLVSFLIYKKETEVVEQPEPPQVERVSKGFIFSNIPKNQINAKQLAYEMQFCRMLSKKMPEVMVSFSSMLMEKNDAGTLAQLNRVKTTVTSFTRVIERNASIQGTYDSVFKKFYDNAANEIAIDALSYEQSFASYIVCYEKYS